MSRCEGICFLHLLPDPQLGRAPLRVLFREAWLQDALLYLDYLDALRVPERAATLDELLRELAAAPGLVLLADVAPWPQTGRRPFGAQQILFRVPDPAQRRFRWRAQLDSAGIALTDADLGDLSERFRRTPAQIADAAGCVASQPFRVDDERDEQGKTSIGLREHLFAAARAQFGRDPGRAGHQDHAGPWLGRHRAPGRHHRPAPRALPAGQAARAGHERLGGCPT